MARLSRRSKREEDLGDLSGRLVTVNDPFGAASEAYRTLRTNLFYSVADIPPKVIALTSPGPQEGKSTTCANLGVVLAQADQNTLIVDCDLRKPVVHKVFGLRNIHGLMNVLAGEYDLHRASQEPLKNLKVLPVGPVPVNPAEVLSSRRFAGFLEEMRKEFDYILIDAPPAQAVSDPAILGSQVDGVLLVLDAQSTRKGAVRRVISNLEAVGANVLGTVMNNTKTSGGGHYYGNYTYK